MHLMAAASSFSFLSLHFLLLPLHHRRRHHQHHLRRRRHHHRRHLHRTTGCHQVPLVFRH